MNGTWKENPKLNLYLLLYSLSDAPVSDASLHVKVHNDLHPTTLRKLHIVLLLI